MKSASLCVFCLAILAGTAHGEQRTVDYPRIEGANTISTIVTKAELSDTATRISLRSHDRPGRWFKVAPDSYIIAGGDTLAMRSAEGIVPGSKHKVPEQGYADYTLSFPPVREDVESLKFAEPGNGGWKIWGIDLTGKPEPAGYPAGLPAELCKAPADGPLPVPARLESGESTVNIHILNYDPIIGDILSVNLSGVNMPPVPQTVTLDAGGNGHYRGLMVGPTLLSIALDDSRIFLGDILVAPGETADFYIDARVIGDRAQKYRPEEYRTPIRQRRFVKGVYGDLCNFREIIPLPSYDFVGDMRVHTFTPDQYADSISSAYRKALASLEEMDLPQMLRESARVDIDVEYLASLAQSNSKARRSYYDETHDRKGLDNVSLRLDGTHFREAARVADPGNPALLLGSKGKYGRISGHVWNKDTESPTDIPDAVSDFTFASNYYLRDDSMRTMICAKLDSLGYGDLVDIINAKYARDVAMNEALKSKVAPVPQVSPDSLFKAIIAPYKGKVVLVDLWNTWCAPCRNAIKMTEPEKEKEFADPDIVWIYIADTSSDAETYSSMIPGIRGIHYRLDEEQIGALHSQFGVSGIPYYILVQRDGSFEGRPDMRDHSRFRKEIHKALVANE